MVDMLEIVWRRMCSFQEDDRPRKSQRNPEASIELVLCIEFRENNHTTHTCRSPKPRTFGYVSSELSLVVVAKEVVLHLSAVYRGYLTNQLGPIRANKPSQLQNT